MSGESANKPLARLLGSTQIKLLAWRVSESGRKASVPPGKKPLKRASFVGQAVLDPACECGLAEVADVGLNIGVATGL